MRTLIAILICMLAIPAYAQERSRSSDYVHMPINISIHEDNSLGHLIAGREKIVNYLSLNLISGEAAKLRGIEAGFGGNIYSEDAIGIQAAGLANVTGGGFGIQGAGLANVSQESYIGIQSAGLANVVQKNFVGVQSAFAANVVLGDGGGIQAGGIANVVEGRFIGVQGSYVANVVQDDTAAIQVGGLANVVQNRFIGIQIGGLANVTGSDTKGIQVAGLANVAGHAFHGIQYSNLANVVQGNAGGIQASGLANVVQGDFFGIQGAGLANVIEDEASGIQVSGVANVVQGGFHGIQGSGFANVIENDLYGVQAAGFASVIEGYITGIQASGFANIIEGKAYGIQGAGFANVIEDGLYGFQAAGIANVSDTIPLGVQISGFANYAETVEKGVQIAPLNVSEENRGLPLGLVSCVEGVKGAIDLWVSEAKFVNAGIRSGTEYFHNLLFAGAQMGYPSRWSVGWGVGSRKEITDTTYLEIDANVQHINEDEFWTSEQNMLGKFRVAGRWSLNDDITLFAGPTYNYLISEVSDGSDYASWSLSEKGSAGDWERSWIGLDIGMRFEGIDLYSFFARSIKF